MTGNFSSGETHEPQEEKMSGQRNTRRRMAYSLTAVMAALVVAVLGLVFAYQSITESISSHVHAAGSEPHSHEDDAAIEKTMDMTSLDEMHEEPALDVDAEDASHNDASHEDASHNDASEDHGHS